LHLAQIKTGEIPEFICAFSVWRKNEKKLARYLQYIKANQQKGVVIWNRNLPWSLWTMEHRKQI